MFSWIMLFLNAFLSLCFFQCFVELWCFLMLCWTMFRKNAFFICWKFKFCFFICFDILLSFLNLFIIFLLQKIIRIVGLKWEFEIDVWNVAPWLKHIEWSQSPLWALGTKKINMTRWCQRHGFGLGLRIEMIGNALVETVCFVSLKVSPPLKRNNCPDN